VAAQPRHHHRLLAFVDPLLGGAAFVMEAHRLPALQTQVGRDEARARRDVGMVSTDLGLERLNR